MSVLWCIIRCCCCGLSCCCNCFQCMKCCGNCCGCCDPPGGRKHKYLDEPYIPPHHGQGYRTEAPMQAHFAPSAPPAPSKFEPPQYAEFEVGKKGSEDALPQMPSWEQAGSRKVMSEHEEVEMSNLKKSPTLPLNNSRMNSPSPGPVSPMSTMGPMGMNHNRPYGGLPGSSSGHMSNHSQQALVPNQQSTGYSQPGQGPYGARDHGYNNNFDANRQSAGFGLDDPYDDHTPVSGTNGYGHPGQQNQPYEAPGQQTYDNSHYGAMAAAGAVGAAGAAGAMAMRNQSTSPHNHPYGAPPAVLAEMGPGRQSPAPTHGRSPYGQEQIHEQFAEMPAIPHDRNSVHNTVHAQQNQTSPGDHAPPRELAGSTPPEAYGMRRPGTGDNAPSPIGGRPPHGMDPRMRNSPGPRQTPGHESPYGRPPRGSPAPRNDQGYGRPPQSPRENVNRTYSPAPPRQFTPGPERRFSPGPERQYSPAPGGQRAPRPHPLSKPAAPPSNSFNQSPPQSPITNNAGFDFTSGYSRPKENESQSPPGQSPTTASYPGQKTYQPR